VPRYFFHIVGDNEQPDFEGCELAGADEARAMAVSECRRLMGDAIKAGRLDLTHRIDIEDVFRRSLGTVRFGEAVMIAGWDDLPAPATN
jgi:hypothetical protein